MMRHSTIIPPNKLLGALLIGGKSTRMGAPKTLLCRGQETIGTHLANLMVNTLNEPPVFLGQGPMAPPWDSHPQLADQAGMNGPMGGFVTLQMLFPNQWVLVLAVDLYFFEQEALLWLISHWEKKSHLAIWPKFESRSFGEPLAAIYSPTAITHLVSAGFAGERAIHRALPESLRYQPTIPKYLEHQFQNVNRPEDLPYSMRGL